MGIWDKVKNEGKKVKLQGEVQLLKRELVSRQKTFGIELYDLLTNDKQTLLGVTAGTIFKGNLSGEQDMKEPFDRAREDILGVQAKKDVKQTSLDVLEVKGAHTLPDTTMGQKASKAGAAVSNGAKGTKLQAEMALLDREMKIRKEQFGVQVFDLTRNSQEKKTNNPVKRLSNAVANLSQQEQAIQNSIDTAKTDVAKIQGKIDSKQFEIRDLSGGETEPMMSSGE
jgi:hypothetical protein